MVISSLPFLLVIEMILVSIKSLWSMNGIIFPCSTVKIPFVKVAMYKVPSITSQVSIVEGGVILLILPSL